MHGRRVEYLRQASAELDDAFSWYLERSALAAESFLEEIDHSLLRIAERPDSFPEIEDGARRCVLRRFPYSVIFRTARLSIQIVAVAHQKRRPGYWRLR